MTNRSSLVLALGAALAAAPPAWSADLLEIERQVQADPVLAGVNRDEALVDELRQAVLLPWERAWKALDAAGAPEGADLAWDSAPRRLVRDRDGVKEYAWRLGKGASPEAGAYLARFKRVLDFRLEPLKLEPAERLGSPAEGRAVLDLRYDLRAVTKDGLRRHDRGDLRVALAKGEGGWRLVSIEPARLESLEAARTAFEDATARLGLDRIPVFDRKEAIRRGGYAIASADFDADGRPDLLVGGWGPVQLYRNTGKGFVDVTKAAGLSGETLVKSAAFADMDNDGRRDLLLLRFVEDGQDKDGDFVAYRNAGGGRFERVGQALTRTRKYDRTMPLALADFDRDGTLDLYLGFPGNRDFTNLGREPQPLASQGVWLNDGRWGFGEVAKESGIWRQDNLYPHSAIAADLDLDGWPDLVVMNDRAGPSPVYRNKGGGLFEEVSARSGIVNESWAMTAAAGDYDGDGYTDLAVTNIEFLASRRLLASRAGRESGPEEKAALEGLRRNTPGNRLFRNRGDGTFEETTDRAGLRWAGEGPAGAEWIDYNSDGWPDLYVMNGLWTGGPKDISSLFARLHAHRRADYVNTLVVNTLNSPLAQGDEAVEGPNPFLGILRADPALSMAGGQRNRLFRNNGDGTFTELGFLAGADRTEDGYVVASADLDGDGNQDLLLRNGDPAPGRPFPVVVALRNTLARGSSLTAFVEGSKSNRDGYGARVTAVVGGRRLVREVRGVTGASQSEPVAFFGLGDAKRADRLEVLWPSGLKEEFQGVSAGRVLLREGKGITRLAARAAPRAAGTAAQAARP